MELGFHHGALCDSYEQQANEQGFTLGIKWNCLTKLDMLIICFGFKGI